MPGAPVVIERMLAVDRRWPAVLLWAAVVFTAALAVLCAVLLRSVPTTPLRDPAATFLRDTLAYPVLGGRGYWDDWRFALAGVARLAVLTLGIAWLGRRLLAAADLEPPAGFLVPLLAAPAGAIAGGLSGLVWVLFAAPALAADGGGAEAVLDAASAELRRGAAFGSFAVAIALGATVLVLVALVLTELTLPATGPDPAGVAGAVEEGGDVGDVGAVEGVGEAELRHGAGVLGGQLGGCLAAVLLLVAYLAVPSGRFTGLLRFPGLNLAGDGRTFWSALVFAVVLAGMLGYVLGFAADSGPAALFLLGWGGVVLAAGFQNGLWALTHALTLVGDPGLLYRAGLRVQEGAAYASALGWVAGLGAALGGALLRWLVTIEPDEAAEPAGPDEPTAETISG